MREIGGYIELDQYNLPMLHADAIMLNCGRNALAYILEARKIRKIMLPYFLCDSVREVCKKYDVSIRYYHIKENFELEDVEPYEDEWLYIVNYYGQKTRQELLKFVHQYQRIIIDNAQDYYAEPLQHIDTIYTCRKYFGVSDGAILYTDKLLSRELPRDESYERIHYILGRYERSASEFYAESSRNNEFFANQPIKQMSKLTYNLLHGIDYEYVKEARTDNFTYLKNRLEEFNQLKVRMVNGAFMYPFMVRNAEEVKQRLLEEKIFIPVLWPNVLKDVPQEWTEWMMAKYILPLPCDQRYGIEEMRYMCEVIYRCIN